MCPQFRRSLYSSATVQAPPLGRVERQVKAFWMERQFRRVRGSCFQGKNSAQLGSSSHWQHGLAGPPVCVEGRGFLQGLQSESRINGPLGADSPVAVGAFSGASVDF